MWTDWTQINLLDSVFFSILSIGVLYVVGFAILRLISKVTGKNGSFASFDFLQRLNFRILFGFIFVVLFVVIFAYFNLSFEVLAIIIVGIVAVGLIVKRSSFKLKVPNVSCSRGLVFSVLVLVILLLTLVLSSMMVAGSYGATNDDGADHTLMVRMVLDNPSVLITRSAQPYAAFLIRYPLGTHILGAFFVTLFNVPVQKIVVFMSVIFPALIALSFYTATKCIFESRKLAFVSLIISAFFTIGLTLSPVSWGGLPFLLSAFFWVSSMGLIFSFLLKEKITGLNAFLIGIVFFAASRTYPIALLMLVMWLFIVLSFKLFGRLWVSKPRKLAVLHFLAKKNIVYLICFVLPLLLALPYFSSLLTNNFDALQVNLFNIISNWVEPIKASVGFNWLLDLPALASFFSRFGILLGLTPLCLLPLILLSIPQISRRFNITLSSKQFRHSILMVYIFALTILAYLTLTLFLPVDFLISFFDPARVYQCLFVPATFLTAVVIFSGLLLFYEILKRLLYPEKKLLRVSNFTRNRVLVCMLVGLLAVSSVIFIIPIVSEQQRAFSGARASFIDLQTLKQDDLSVMEWIIGNVPLNKTILVSSGDSGQFLAAVTQRDAISINSRLANYSDLMDLLTSNSSDLRAVPIMVQYNISYVYIGSTATGYGVANPYYRAFNSTQFFSTPYFELTKEIGNAWLFEFNATKAAQYV
jgi:hypothetical protein